MGCTKLTGQSVVTPRSNTITGTPVWQARSMAGVNALVVFGETISALQPLVCRSVMSVISLSSLPPASSTVNSLISGCSFTSAFMVVRPVTRQGLSSAALEKHRCHLPCFVYFAVSTMDGWIICSQGVFGSPCGAIRRCAIWRSKSAWLKNFDCGAAAEGRLPGWSAGVGLLEVHAAEARRAAATRAAGRRLHELVMPSRPPPPPLPRPPTAPSGGQDAGTVAILVLPRRAALRRSGRHLQVGSCGTTAIAA